ncbi:hypothetical protein HPB51_012129 [Rhipicephalus microplus]|uniref:Uncharacterized protein n=1 Tax=Rhipicephalus microplus TaxID=6941 RepID=A0A9J6DUF8_RHIMP|nr:hypothetical protein HPB51_012129 [Rhipicephalus microplus]
MKVKDSPAKSIAKVSHSEGEKLKLCKAKPVVCHRCNEPGLIAISCRKPKSTLFQVDSSDGTQEQLKLHVQEAVKKKALCNVPQDSAATFDSVDSYSWKNEVATGKRMCARQIVENKSLCLPLARVEKEGTLRLLATETVLSQNMPKPYSSQNDVDMLLKGLCFGDKSAAALTRPMACESAHEIPEAESTDEVDCKVQNFTRTVTWHFSRSVEYSLFVVPRVLRGSFLAFAGDGSGPEIGAACANIYKKPDLWSLRSALVLQPLRDLLRRWTGCYDRPAWLDATLTHETLRLILP